MKLAVTTIALLYVMVVTEATKPYPHKVGHQKQFNENIFRLNKRPRFYRLEEHHELGDLSSIEEALDRLTKKAAITSQVDEKDMESIVESLIDVASRLVSAQNEKKSVNGQYQDFAINDQHADQMKHDPLYSMRMWKK